MSDKDKKNFEAIFTKTRIYLVVIAIVLIILCIQNIVFVVPSIVLYGILIVYTFLTNNKNKTELDKHIQELTFNVDTVAKNAMINSPFPLIMVDEDGTISWKSANFVSEFGNIDIKSILDDVFKEVKTEAENLAQKNDKNVIYKQIEVGRKNYQIIIETIKSKSKNRKKKLRLYVCNVFYR